MSLRWKRGGKMNATNPTEKQPMSDTTKTKEGIQVATVVDSSTTPPRDRKR
jgi:hypothetical protein